VLKEERIPRIFADAKITINKKEEKKMGNFERKNQPKPTGSSTPSSQPESKTYDRMAVIQAMDKYVNMIGFGDDETLKIIEIVKDNLEICPDREDLLRLGLNAIYEMQLKNRAQRIKIMDMIDGSFGAGVMEEYAKMPYTEIWQYTNGEVAERMKEDAEGYLAEVQAELVANKLNRICLEYAFGKYTMLNGAEGCTDPNQIAVWSQNSRKLSRPISPGDIFLASYNGVKNAWMYMPKGCVAIQCDMPG
jgi:hypothetical protein